MHPNTRHCAYIKVDGRPCGSPAWQDFDFCWHHHGLEQRFAAERFTFPALDDPNAIQVAVMETLNAFLTGKLSRPDAYMVIYALYLARTNVKATTLSPPTPNDFEEMLATARAEGRAEGLKEGRKQAQKEFEREAERKGDEDYESLAAFLLRELKDPPGGPLPSLEEDRARTEAIKEMFQRDPEEWRGHSDTVRRHGVAAVASGAGNKKSG